MLASTFLMVAAAALGLASPTVLRPSTSAPDPNDVYIKSFAYAGTGCPAGSVANATDGTKQVLTLLFDDYVASIGPGTAVSDRRKNCQINLDIHYPGGFQFSLFSVDYRGYQDLDAGVTGAQVANYYFSGEQQQATVSTNFKGPTTGDYLLTDEFIVTSIVWSPCGAPIPLNINSQIRLTSTSTTAAGLLTTDSTDFKVAQIYHLQWRPCTA